MVFDDAVDLMNHAHSRKDLVLLDAAGLQQVQEVVESRKSVLGRIAGQNRRCLGARGRLGIHAGLNSCSDFFFYKV